MDNSAESYYRFLEGDEEALTEIVSEYRTILILSLIILLWQRILQRIPS